MNQVKVIKGQTGMVITPNPKKPEWNFFLVEEVAGLNFQNGFLRGAKKVAITVAPQDLVWAQANIKENMFIPGRIQVTESHSPFYDGQEPKKNPTTNVVVTSNGQPVYQQRRFNQDVNCVDTLLGNDRVQVAASAQSGSDILQQRLMGVTA